MDNTNDIHGINEAVLLDYFAGLLSIPEKERVDQWLDKSEENQKLAKDVHYLYLASNAVERVNRIDSRKGLEKVNRKIKSRKRIVWATWFQRVAAILIIPLIVATFYLYSKPEIIEDIEIKTNPGMFSSVILPDGSTAYLNSMSSLKYASRFTGSTREVYVDGEAYFTVKKDEEKPFIVHTPFDFSAEVLGTEFNIEAYNTASEVKTILVSGSVRLKYNGDQLHILKPNEEFIYNPQTTDIKLDKPFIPTKTAWKDGYVHFDNTPLEEALQILSKRFNVEFIVKNARLYDNNFTFKDHSQQLSTFLYGFHISTGIQYRLIEAPNVPTDEFTPKTVVELY